jgi:hypothetical protein
MVDMFSPYIRLMRSRLSIGPASAAVQSVRFVIEKKMVIFFKKFWPGQIARKGSAGLRGNS